ncbi:MAG: phosphoenolpyruvate carboxykinase domain-containing protein [Hyphomicrobium sp.]
MPKIFQVNWFRKNKNGKFMWPGYSDNSRVLKWIFERCDGRAAAVETPIGRLPADGTLDTKGVKVDPTDLKDLLSVDKEGWKSELPSIREHFATFGAKLPKQLNDELNALGAAARLIGRECRLTASVRRWARTLVPCTAPRC